jgi:hypothetical protein
VLDFELPESELEPLSVDDEDDGDEEPSPDAELEVVDDEPRLSFL